MVNTDANTDASLSTKGFVMNLGKNLFAMTSGANLGPTYLQTFYPSRPYPR